LNEQALSKGRRIVELGDEIEQLPGFKLYYQDLKALDISLYIFNRNYIDLRNIITFITTDPRGAMFYTVENRYKLEELGYNVICRIHNYVAAAKSLVDHTHNLYGKLYEVTDLFPEYQERIDNDFKYDPLSKFVQDLRRYCQHYKSPIVMFRTTLDSHGSPSRSISIPLDDLQAFKKWSAPAKKYLRTIHEKVDVLEVATAYRDKVIAFHNWFRSRQEEINANELKELDDKKDELRSLMGSLSRGLCK
jgi:hypothetical protein